LRLTVPAFISVVSSVVSFVLWRRIEQVEYEAETSNPDDLLETEEDFTHGYFTEEDGYDDGIEPVWRDVPAYGPDARKSDPAGGYTETYGTTAASASRSRGEIKEGISTSVHKEYKRPETPADISGLWHSAEDFTSGSSAGSGSEERYVRRETIDSVVRTAPHTETVEPRMKGSFARKQAAYVKEDSSTPLVKPKPQQKTDKAAFCVFCGHPVNAGSRFCTKCGKPIV